MPRLATGAALLAAALAGAGIGWSLGRNNARVEHAGSASTDVRPMASAGARGTADAAFDGVRTPGPGDDLGRESARALRDPAYLRNLLQRYAAETEPDRKGALRAVLQSAGNDEVLRNALAWAASAEPGTRRDGLALLAAFPLDRAEVRDALFSQLRSERDPRMQAELLDMLAPVPMAAEDARPLLARLERLRGAEDARVRAAAVRQTAQWDRSEAVEGVLHEALLDADPQVRQAALAGVYVSGQRSPRLKDALLAIASDARAGQDERQAAILALQPFPMDRAEYGVYRAAADALDEARGR